MARLKDRYSFPAFGKEQRAGNSRKAAPNNNDIRLVYAIQFGMVRLCLPSHVPP
jgi:hypothetical protein